MTDAAPWSGLPVPIPLAPMLARSVPSLPQPDTAEGGLIYEPKWDGFRALICRDGEAVELFSRSQRPMGRYFPELIEQALEHLPPRCVIDGEIIMIAGGEGKKALPRLDFELLQQRLHPAASRVRKLAGEIPAVFVAFDLIAVGEQSLMDLPLAHRREQLQRLIPATNHSTVQALIRQPQADAQRLLLTPATTDPHLAQQWLTQFEGAGLDGVVAKLLEGPYTPNVRSMIKIKHARTADCVVAGYRLHKTSTAARPLVGSLLLGLHDAQGRLHHVGVSASFPIARRAQLVQELEPYLLQDLSQHPWGQWAQALETTGSRMPGGQSRWSAGKDLSWVALRPELVCEVAYDHLEGDRFRHTAQFHRWRPDRTPDSCTYAQVEEPISYDLAQVLSASAV